MRKYRVISDKPLRGSDALVPANGRPRHFPDHAAQPAISRIVVIVLMPELRDRVMGEQERNWIPVEVAAAAE